MGVGRRQELSFHEFNSSVSSVFFHEFGNLCEIHEFCKFCEFGKICKIDELQNTDWFHDRCSGLVAQLVIRWCEKLYCVPLVLCVYFIIIIIAVVIIIIIITISFVVLLNYLHLKPRVLLFVHSAPHSTGGGGGASKWLHGSSCQLPR